VNIHHAHDDDVPLMDGVSSRNGKQNGLSGRVLNGKQSVSIRSSLQGLQGLLPLLLGLGFVTMVTLLYIHDRRAHLIPTEPPRSMIFRGKRGSYAKVPPKFRRTFHIPDGTKFRRTVARAFRYNNFRKVDHPEEANFIIDKGEDPSRYPELQPWQRYNSIPGTQQFESKGESCL
jgi:hypothetical protein